MASINAFAYIPSLAFSLLLLCFCSRSVASDQQGFVKLNITSLLPSDTCVPSTTKGPSNHTIKMTHLHGPCSPSGLNKSAGTSTMVANLTDIILSDRLEMKYMAMKLGKEKSTDVSSLTVPTIGKKYLGFGIEIGLGAPTMTKQFVTFSTAANLCWVNCKHVEGECTDSTHCYGPYTNFPTSSASLPYGTGTPECEYLEYPSTNEEEDCLYSQYYGDVVVTGILGHDMLTLENEFLSFVFGCGDTLTGAVWDSDGLIGMGRGPLSLNSQLEMPYDKVFSYCLPLSQNDQGYLHFGPPANSTEYEYTPMLTSCPGAYYFVELMGINIADEFIPITPMSSAYGDVSCETIISSSIALTYIPSTAYDRLASIFSKRMSTRYQTTEFSEDYLCYDVTGYEEDFSVPEISLVLRNANIPLTAYQIMIVLPLEQETVACFAFQPNDKGYNVIGHTQQKSYEVVYNVNNMEIGFASGAC